MSKSKNKNECILPEGTTPEHTKDMDLRERVMKKFMALNPEDQMYIHGCMDGKYQTLLNICSRIEDIASEVEQVQQKKDHIDDIVHGHK